MSDMNYLKYLEEIAQRDAKSLEVAAKSYGDSFKRRGGVGHFMMLARKWDRLELACQKKGWDIYKCIEEDKRSEGIIDDVRDLRRYLMLVEAEMMAKQMTPAELKKNTEVCDGTDLDIPGRLDTLYNGSDAPPASVLHPG